MHFSIFNFLITCNKYENGRIRIVIFSKKSYVTCRNSKLCPWLCLFNFPSPKFAVLAQIQSNLSFSCPKYRWPNRKILKRALMMSVHLILLFLYMQNVHNFIGNASFPSSIINNSIICITIIFAIWKQNFSKIWKEYFN